MSNISHDKVILMADYGRSGQGWLSYMLCYILNAKYIEPYDFLKGMLYTTDERVRGLTSGNLPGRPKGRSSMIIKTHNWPAIGKKIRSMVSQAFAEFLNGCETGKVYHQVYPPTFSLVGVHAGNLTR